MVDKNVVVCIRCGECCKTVPCVFAQIKYGLDEWNGKECPELKMKNGFATCLWIERDPWMQANFIGTGCEKPVYPKIPKGKMSLLDVIKECASNKEFVKQFNRLYECHLLEDDRPPIVQLVDKSTGYQKELDERQMKYMREFMIFVYETVWT